MQTFSPDNTGHAKMAATCKRAKRFLWLRRKWPLRKTMHNGPERSHRNVSYVLHLKKLKILPKCQFYTRGDHLFSTDRKHVNFGASRECQSPREVLSWDERDSSMQRSLSSPRGELLEVSVDCTDWRLSRKLG